MYAIGRMAEALITPPIADPRHRRGTPAEGPATGPINGIGDRRARIRAIAHDAWLSFLPRLRNYPS